MAIADLNKAIELEPDNPTIYHNRAYIYLNTDQLYEAIADESKAIELDASYALAYYNRGIVYYNIGEIDLAIADLNKAIELSDDSDLTAAAKQSIEAIESKHGGQQ